MTAGPRGTREVIDGIFADAATGDLDRVLSWWAEDGVLEDVTIAKAYVGKPAIRAYLAMYFSALPDLSFAPLRLVVEGPTAVVEWAQSTRLAAPFDGLPADGRVVFLRAVDVFHVHGGLVRHEASWYGDAWLRQRLGGGGEEPPPPLPLDHRRLLTPGSGFDAEEIKA